MSLSGPRPNIRIGVLCGQSSLVAWQVECLRKVHELPFVEFVAFVVDAQLPPPRKPFVTRLKNKLASGLLLWRLYERFVLERKSRAMQPAELPSSLVDLPRLECAPIKEGKFRQRFDDASLEALRTYDVDVLIRFGFGILTGEILSLPRYGVLSYHHGDPEQFRGAPPGFWEIRHGAQATGVVLQKLTEKLDGGIVLQSGWFKTIASSYPKSLDRIMFGTAHFVARALVEINADPEALLDRTPIPAKGPVYRYPRSRDVMQFLAKCMGAWLRAQYHSLFRHQQWTLGTIAKTPLELFREIIGTEAPVENVRWLPERGGRFLADPFVLPAPQDGNGLLVLAEEFDWRTDRGHIAKVDCHASTGPNASAAIMTDLHLSYPYLITEKGVTYCVPESAEGQDVRLYELDQSSGQWVKRRTLLQGFPAIDPTIFMHDGRWWLFCTSAEAGANEVLYAWHASKLEGDWTPHIANPIKVDVRSARPAGRPFAYDGKMIRPAQDCSGNYGGGIAFNRLLHLTPEAFEEEVVAKLMPEAGIYREGMHTISGAKGITVIDGARLTFIGAEFRRALYRKFRRADR